MFIAALLTIAKIWRQPVSINLYSGILLSHNTTQNKILPFATTWMDLEGIMLSAISQTDKDKYYTLYRDQTSGYQCGEGRKEGQDRGRGNSLAVQWLGHCAFAAGDTGSIPSQGTEILHAAWHN